MMKKRGMFIIGVLLVASILVGTQILAEDEISTAPAAPFVTYESVLLYDARPHIDMCDPGEDCSQDCDWVPFPSEQGCRMYSADEVDRGDDGCYTNTLPSGYNIGERSQSTNERFVELSDFYEQVQVSSDFSVVESVVRWELFLVTLGFSEVFNAVSNRFSSDNEGAQRYFFEHPFNYQVEQGGVLCGNDHYWYQCDAAHERTLYWIEAEFPLEEGVTVNRPVLLYECQEKVEGGYAWVHQGTDLDGDSYLSTGGIDDGGRDCVDFGPFDENMGCPDLEDYQGKTREEIRDLLKDACNYPSNSLCAACINPAAPEICGDNINNDCGGRDGRESRSELNGNTPDDCNKFAAGCEQKTITEATRVRENVEVDEEAPPEVQHYNVYDEQFSWTPTDDGGYCCGYNGINDLGEKRTALDGNNRICLHRNTYLVGREGDIPSCDGGGADDTGEWCWATASEANTKFHIFTIKKPAEEAYDVVSNNNDWIECKDGEGTKGISAAGAVFNPDDMDDANRFYCYKEGNHWSWADCRDPNELTSPSVNGIKERAQGDGLFAFPLQNREEAAAGVETVFVDIGNAYTPFYGDGRLDFSGFNPMYLEFYLRFKTLNVEVPPDVHLKIQGPQQEGQYVTYYGQPILGYAINTPLLEENRWIHLKVPLSGEMLDVKSIEIKSMTRGNTLEVKNIYLSDGSSRICSGTRSSTADESSWLTDLDFSSSQSTLSAEKLCNALFDPAYETTVDPSAPYQGKAWLGDYDEVDSASPTANCCGNNENEYYGGASREIDGKFYGCWNSEAIASGETTMNVEVGVEYKEETISIHYLPLNFNRIEYVTLKIGNEVVEQYQEQAHTRALQYAGGPFTTLYTCPTISRDDSRFPTRNCASTFSQRSDYNNCRGTESCSTSLSPEPISVGCSVQSFDAQGAPSLLDISCQGSPTIPVYLELTDVPEDTEGIIFIVNDETFYRIAPQTETIRITPSTPLSLSNSPLIVQPLEVEQGDFLDIYGQPYGGITLTNSNPDVDLFFIDGLTGEDIGTEIDASILRPGNNLFSIIAKVKGGAGVEVTRATEERQQSFTFSCPSSEQSECSYPLPGEPPYTITNSHPDLYELYFIPKVETGNPAPILITSINNHFTTPGMIQARKVAQQVLFVNEGEDADEDPSFYGCQAASYLEQAPAGQAAFENLNYCSTKASKFCAYSVAQEDRREKFTTINSWDDAEITKVGYAPLDQVEGDVNNFYDSIELQLRETGADLPYEPKDRNHSASVLPTRNFIPNAQFLRSGMVIPHWDIRLADGTRKENLRSNLVNDELYSITLEGDETLRSEQIAIPANSKLSFSATTTCTPTIKLVDKDGVVVPITVPTSFNTGSASYLQLEFQGACTLHSPLLQVVDDLPQVSFNYLHQEYPDGFDARAGAACCPQNYCWNGYACVEPMGSSTYLAEHVADGRDYRCIEGKWKYLPLQFDWNGQKWGFCAQPEQCLVLPSTLGGSAEYSALDFYEGHYPACIDDGKYIFDNVCNKGNWTSRTKYVATKLLEVGENSDYVLYCTEYRQALLEFDNRENYLGGEFVQQPQNAPTLTETLSGPAAPVGLATCFNTIQDPEGRRLVPDEENTCINNVCVLKFKQGGDFKVAFATTTNKDILGEDSFLFALNLPSNRLDQLCTGTGDFVRCDLTGLNIPGDLWYAKKLNATIYGRQGLQLTPTLVDRILNWLARFVGVQSELSDESAFISQAQNFREVYVLSLGDKKVRALKEVLSANKQTLLAEYEHFSTPVCDYVKNLALPPEAGTELLEELSGQQKIICNNMNGTQRVEAVAGLDFFWPQLTGRLRVS